MQLTLRHKVNSAIIITFLFIALLFILIQLPFQRHQLQRSIDNIEILLQTLVERDTEQLANEIFDDRVAAITIRIEDMRKVEGILGISVFNTSGKVLATSGNWVTDRDIASDELEKISQHAQLEKIEWQDQKGIRYSKELSFLGERLGFIRLHYSLKRVEEDQKNSFLIFGALLVTILIAMLASLNLILSQSILNPIMYLRDATQFIVQGNLDKDIIMPRKDELGSLAGSFNKMRDAIKEQITQLNIEIEERKLAEHNLKITLDSIGDGVITTDMTGHITRMNPIAEHLTGWENNEAIGTPLCEVLHIVHPDTGYEAENPFEKVIASDNIEVIAERTLLISKDGSEYLIANSGAPIRSESGETFGVVLVFRDITEENLLQEQLRQSYKMDAIGQLAGGIAHDFNNMLGGITGAAEMLAFYLPDDPKAKRFHTIILEAAGRSAELIAKLLAFSRNSPKLSTTIDIHEVIKGANILLENSLDRRISLNLNLTAEKSTIVGDPTQLQSAFLNMGINASHAMPEGGTVHISTSTLILDLPYCQASPFDLQPGEYIEIEVRDTGLGIAPENLKRIFDPFFTTKEQGHGTGLGLAAVYGTIQQHHGAITAYSEQEEGTTFQLLLPISDQDEAVQPAIQLTQKGSGRILVVDDEEVMRITAKAILEELGYEVLLAENGREALKIYTDNPGHIDLVILDMVMPLMNGRDCFAALKRHDPEVRVILSSGFTREESLQEMKAQGLRGFIRKPYLSNSFSQIIHESLQ